VTVTSICDAVSTLYDGIDRDLLITCAILHDIGKIKEYTLAPFIDFTDEGRLIGHVVIGNKMVVDKCEEINNFPQKLLMKIQHLLLSHHGEREHGAAVPQKQKRRSFFIMRTILMPRSPVQQISLRKLLMKNHPGRIIIS